MQFLFAVGSVTEYQSPRGVSITEVGLRDPTGEDEEAADLGLSDASLRLVFAQPLVPFVQGRFYRVTIELEDTAP